MNQPEHGTNTSYLIDFIQICFNVKLLNFEEIRSLYLEKRLSATQIAHRYQVSKTVILDGLHKMGIRFETGTGRMTDPNNYRIRTPPYGFSIKDGKLVPHKLEMKICRLVVELIGRQGLSNSATAKELKKYGYKNRYGRTVWDHSSVRNIFKRWKDKL